MATLEDALKEALAAGSGIERDDIDDLIDGLAAKPCPVPERPTIDVDTSVEKWCDDNVRSVREALTVRRLRSLEDVAGNR